MEDVKKRKTNTSAEVKARYNKKTYESLFVNLPKDMAQKFKQKCKEEGISQAKIIKEAVEAFLESN